MPCNYTSFALGPVDHGTLFFKLAADVLGLPHFHPSLVMLAVELVAHEDHGSAVVDAALRLPGAFQRAEFFPMMFALPFIKAGFIDSSSPLGLSAVFTEHLENVSVVIRFGQHSLEQTVNKFRVH